MACVPRCEATTGRGREAVLFAASTGEETRCPLGQIMLQCLAKVIGAGSLWHLRECAWTHLLGSIPSAFIAKSRRGRAYLSIGIKTNLKILEEAGLSRADRQTPPGTISPRGKGDEAKVSHLLH